MFGLPALSDAKGRKFSILVAFVLQIVGISLMILGIYQDISVLMIFGQLLTGIYASGILILTYIVTGEFCSNSTRQTAIMIYCSMW
jgi:MFS family permease